MKNSTRLLTLSLVEFFELSLTIFSPVLLLCRNQYNTLICKSIDWFLHYSNTLLNWLAKLQQITGDKFYHATFVCLHLWMFSKLEVFIIHCSIMGNSLNGFMNWRYIPTFFWNFEPLFVCFLWSDLLQVCNEARQSMNA